MSFQKKVVVIGCGDIGITLAAGLNLIGVAVYGVRRQAQRLPSTIIPIPADVTSPISLQALSEHSFDTAIITLTPGEYSQARYELIFERGVANVLAVLQARHVIFVSSSSVYHQSDDQWINEDDPTEPHRFAGQVLLRAEQLISSISIESTIVRFSGIYGPGRTRLIKQVLAGQQSPPIFSNRIHRDDCAGFLQHLMTMAWQNSYLHPCYLATDSEPALLCEVKSWLARQLGVELPVPHCAAAGRNLSRRCSNQRLLATGYSLQYPNYRSGYSAIIEAELSRPD